MNDSGRTERDFYYKLIQKYAPNESEKKTLEEIFNSLDGDSADLTEFIGIVQKKWKEYSEEFPEHKHKKHFSKIWNQEISDCLRIKFYKNKTTSNGCSKQKNCDNYNIHSDWIEIVLNH